MSSEPRWGGVVDFHVHPLPLLPEHLLLDELEASGVSKCVLLALDVDHRLLDDAGFQALIAQKVAEAGLWGLSAIDYMKTLLQLGRTPNEHVASLVRAHPDRFFGVGSINPSLGMEYVRDKLEELRRFKLNSVKLIPTLQLFNPQERIEELREIFSYVASRRGLVVLHSGCDPGPWENPNLSQDAKPSKYLPLIQEYPDVPTIIAHAGSYSMHHPAIWLDETLKICKKHEHVWVDTAAVSYLMTERKYVEKIRSTIGMNRVLFGSDYPTVTRKTIKDSIEDVAGSTAISEEEKEAVLWLNAERLLGKL